MANTSIQLGIRHNTEFNKRICKQLNVKKVHSMFDPSRNITGYTKAKVMEEVLLGAYIGSVVINDIEFKFLIKGDHAILLDHNVFG